MLPVVIASQLRGWSTLTNSTLETGEYIDAGGYRTHYHEAGSGDTVVFIHGSGPGVTSWANWRNALPVFAERFHVLAPDLLGFGSSARPTNARYEKDLWVDHLRAFLRAKNVRKCHRIGNSLGGALTLALTVREPELVDRIVLMGAVGVPFSITAGLDAVWGYEPSIETMRKLIAGYFAFDPSLATDDLVRLRYDASRQPGFQESYGAMFPPPRQRHVDALATPDDRISAITARALLVHGREDKVVPIGTSFRLFELLPNADLYVFGRCGHWTMIERRDDFNALVMRFLTAV
jgi:2-hydroxymuconate-semialdehyde hydrolase